MNKRLPTLKTGRLSLRGIEERDTKIIVRWRSDPDVYQYFTSPHALTMEEHRSWFRDVYANDMYRLDWVAERAGRAVGLFGLRQAEPESSEVTISYLIAPEVQRRGYAQEAVKHLLKWAKEHWRSEMGLAEIHKNNIASLRFIRKLGFRPAAEKGNFMIFSRPLQGV